MMPSHPGGPLSPGSPSRTPAAAAGGANLADILERVLDKGIVIAGDIRVNLLDIELLTIKIRLIVASVDRAREMGIDWWERDPSLSSGRPPVTMTSPMTAPMAGSMASQMAGPMTSPLAGPAGSPVTTPMGSTVSTPMAGPATGPVTGPVVTGPVVAGPDE